MTSLVSRHQATLAHAREAGLLGETKNARIAGRVSSALIEAAKRRSGAISNTEVIELALATLAIEDDFGDSLFRRKGSLPRDVDLEF